MISRNILLIKSLEYAVVVGFLFLSCSYQGQVNRYLSSACTRSRPFAGIGDISQVCAKGIVEPPPPSLLSLILRRRSVLHPDGMTI